MFLNIYKHFNICALRHTLSSLSAAVVRRRLVAGGIPSSRYLIRSNSPATDSSRNRNRTWTQQNTIIIPAQTSQNKLERKQLGVTDLYGQGRPYYSHRRPCPTAHQTQRPPFPFICAPVLPFPFLPLPSPLLPAVNWPP